MTGDCHVRFCERLRGETPLCLLGEVAAIAARTSYLSLVTEACGGESLPRSTTGDLLYFGRPPESIGAGFRFTQSDLHFCH